MGRNLLTTLVMLMSFWLVMPVYAQTAISLDLEPLATNAVPAEENLADWQKGLEILQGVTLKERGAEFDYECEGRWRTDQICKYIWASYQSWTKDRYGRSMKFAAAGLALNPKVRQLLNRVGSLLIEHCAEALPFLQRGIGPNDSDISVLTHCRGELASAPNEVRRARRLFWVSGYLSDEASWERQRISSTYYNELEFEAGDILDSAEMSSQARHMSDKAWARRKTLESMTQAAKGFVEYIREDHLSPVKHVYWLNRLNTYPNLPSAEFEMVVKAAAADKDAGGLVWRVPVTTIRNLFEIQANPEVQPVDDLWTFGSLGLRMALAKNKERPSAFEQAPASTRFAWFVANGELNDAWGLQSKVSGAVEEMGFLTLNCLHVSSFDRTLLNANLDLARETTWKALWSVLCKREVNYTAHWIDHKELKGSASLMAAVVQMDDAAMHEFSIALTDSEFMQAQGARLWAGAVLGDVEIFEAAKKAATGQAALKWFDLLAETAFLAKTQGGEKARSHFESLPPYVRSSQPESAEATAYVFVAVRTCAAIDTTFATELNDLYFKDSALGRKLLAIINEQEGK